MDSGMYSTILGFAVTCFIKAMLLNTKQIEVVIMLHNVIITGNDMLHDL